MGLGGEVYVDLPLFSLNLFSYEAPKLRQLEHQGVSSEADCTAQDAKVAKLFKPPPTTHWYRSSYHFCSPAAVNQVCSGDSGEDKLYHTIWYSTAKYNTSEFGHSIPPVMAVTSAITWPKCTALSSHLCLGSFVINCSQ